MTTNKDKADLIYNELIETAKKLAWEEHSGNFAWTEELLEKYKDKVDWSEVSRNCEMQWTNTMLEKFKHLLDWKELSQVISNVELLDKFIDRWDWGEIINSHYLTRHFNKEFLNKYIDHIPMINIKKTTLWRTLLVEEVKRIEHQINYR